jgi:hypothetical protein
VEKLIDKFDSQVSHIFEFSPPRRSLYLCSSDELEQLTDKIQSDSAYFGLLIALDASKVDDDQIRKAASGLLSKGLAYLCAWGPDCERVHDLFDQAAIEINEKLSADDVVMTTWHSGESLEEALWFFAHAAFPTKFFWQKCTDWIVAPIANESWEKQIRAQIHDVVFLPPKQ